MGRQICENQDLGTYGLQPGLLAAQPVWLQASETSVVTPEPLPVESGNRPRALSGCIVEGLPLPVCGEADQ